MTDLVPLFAFTEESEVLVRGDVYYKQDGDGPFCTACYDTDRKLIRLPEMGQHFQAFGKYRCNVCHGRYQGEQ